MAGWTAAQRSADGRIASSPTGEDDSWEGVTQQKQRKSSYALKKPRQSVREAQTASSMARKTAAQEARAARMSNPLVD